MNKLKKIGYYRLRLSVMTEIVGLLQYGSNILRKTGQSSVKLTFKLIPKGINCKSFKKTYFREKH